MLHLYYTNLKKNKEKEKFIKQVQAKCRVAYSTVRSWVADPETAHYRNPKPVYYPILAEITGIPEKELFPEEQFELN